MEIIKLIAAASLLMTATPAFAVKWVYITSSESGTDIYYDADTISRAGEQVIVWERWDHLRDKTHKEREQKTRFQYDCEQRTSTILNIILYYPNKTNKSYTWEKYEQKADPIIPDTVGEAKLEAICAATAR